MNNKIDLYLCMGSTCHQQGVYEVLPKIQQLIVEHNLEESLELKGSFCLGEGVCKEGILMKLENTMFTNINATNIESKFCEEIVPALESIVQNNGSE